MASESKNQHDQELLTVAEAAEILRLKISTLRAWTLQRRIEFVKLGGRVFIRRNVVGELVDRCVVPARNEAVQSRGVQKADKDERRNLIPGKS